MLRNASVGDEFICRSALTFKTWQSIYVTASHISLQFNWFAVDDDNNGIGITATCAVGFNTTTVFAAIITY